MFMNTLAIENKKLLKRRMLWIELGLLAAEDIQRSGSICSGRLSTWHKRRSKQGSQCPD